MVRYGTDPDTDKPDADGADPDDDAEALSSEPSVIDGLVADGVGVDAFELDTVSELASGPVVGEDEQPAMAASTAPHMATVIHLRRAALITPSLVVGLVSCRRIAPRPKWSLRPPATHKSVDQ